MPSDELVSLASNFTILTPQFVEPCGKGSINHTYEVKTSSGSFILQRLHSMFDYTLLEDIDLVTHHLKQQGMVTTELIRTRGGKLGYQDGTTLWRMLTLVPGRTLQQIEEENQAYSAARLLGDFHKKLSTLNYTPQYQIPHFHDTPYIVNRLDEVVSLHKNTSKGAELIPLAQEVLSAYRPLHLDVTRLPRRFIHGDPKINNIRFDIYSDQAESLIDLDTISRNSILYDFGDAARSWCKPSYEEDLKTTEFNSAYFKAMYDGYMDSAGDFITQDERKGLVDSVQLLLLELSARYIIDSFEESYFKLDTNSFPNLFEQNKTKAFAQIELLKDFQKKKSLL